MLPLLPGTWLKPAQTGRGCPLQAHGAHSQSFAVHCLCGWHPRTYSTCCCRHAGGCALQAQRVHQGRHPLVHGGTAGALLLLLLLLLHAMLPGQLVQEAPSQKCRLLLLLLLLHSHTFSSLI